MNTPTLSQLYTAIRDDLKAKLGISSLVGKTVISAFAAVQAGKLKILYLLAKKIYDNIFVDTADADMLRRFGLVKLNRLPTPAVAGVYEIEVTGSDGATVPANTTWKSLDDSTSPDYLFVNDVSYTISGTSVTVQIRAFELGPDARLTAGDELQVTAPIANVDSFATVTAVVTTPVSAESEGEYRKEVIRAYQTEPQGGARTDYRLWASDASGVREVYPYVVSAQPGYIDLYVEANPIDSADGYGTPSPSLLSDVDDVIEFDPDTSKPLNERGRRPLSAFQINFLSINKIAVDVEITALSDASFLTAIENAITDFLFDIRPFVDGADNPQNINKGKLFESDIYNIVRDIIGINATFTLLTLKVDGSAETLYEFTGGNIPYLNSVTIV